MKRQSLLTVCLPVIVALLVLPATQSNAQIVFDLRNNGGLGDILEATRPDPVIQDGITVAASATTTLGDGDGAVFNRNNGPNIGDPASEGGSGVDSGVGGFFGGDVGTAGVGTAEELTFTLTFGEDVPSLLLTSIDFFGVGANTDSATVSVAGNASVTLLDGFGSEFDENLDVYTPATPIQISSGDTIVFSNVSVSSGPFGTAANYSIEAIGFSTATVLLGDVNGDMEVNFLDISTFISILSAGSFQAEADIDGSGNVDFLDIAPFISLLSGP